jgi:lipopolysaccharide export system permease protein
VLMLSLGHTLALSVPMAVLVATLLAFGQMAQDHELTAFKASGISLYRVMVPVCIAASLLGCVMVLFNNYVLPESNHRLAGLISDIGRKRPTVNIEPGVFVDQFPGYKILIGDKKEHSDEIEDVKVYVEREAASPDLLVAPRGRLYFSPDGNTLFVELHDGEMHSLPEQAGSDAVYRVTRFHEQTVVIRDVADRLERTDRTYRSDREMSIRMMRSSIADKRMRIRKLRERVDEQCRQAVQAKLALLDPTQKALPNDGSLRRGHLTSGTEVRLRDTAHIESGAIDGYERQIRSLQVEIHKKYAIPTACLIFVLLGAPLAVRSGRSGMTMAIAFSISCFLVYYLFLTGGEKLADRELLSPFWAMWGANAFFGTIGVVLTWRCVVDAGVFNYRRLDPRTWWPFRRLAA